MFKQMTRQGGKKQSLLSYYVVKKILMKINSKPTVQEKYGSTHKKIG